MPSANQILSAAASHIGVSGTDNIFNTWYWGYHCYDPDVYPWCAAFQSYVFVVDCGYDCQPSASAAGFANQFPRVADEDVQPGDLVLFNWNGSQSFEGYADHIGVVEWTDINGSGLFGTIEGNTGNVWGGEVARCTRNNNSYYGTAFYRPSYSDQDTPVTPDQYQQDSQPVNDAGLYYRVHAQNAGWLPPVHDGMIAGTTGKALRMEAFKITPPEGWVLDVKVHEQDYGWETYKGIEKGESSGEGSSPNDPIIGTVGESRRIEDVEIDVVEKPEGDDRDLYFRVHQENVGWKGWTKSGFSSGTDGMGIRLEAIEMKIE